MPAKRHDKSLERQMLKAQGNEITEHVIYSRLARSVKDAGNRKVLEHIAQDELRHYSFWKEHTGREVSPSVFNAWKYHMISRIFGLTFGIKLMERGEQKAQVNYSAMARAIPGVKRMEKDESQHEKHLIGMIDEERLRYVGSIVLGLNDALVELTGALAGFTFALASTQLIALAGLITGIAASMSMSASAYLSAKSEAGEIGKTPLKASVYTGVAYVFTVLFLIFPYFVMGSVLSALAVTLVNAIIVMVVFTFYVSVAKDVPFKRRFAEMAGISLGVAALSFVIGFLIKIFLGINV